MPNNKTFSPKIYFDELINQVNIDIEDALKSYNENQVLEESIKENFEINLLSISDYEYLDFIRLTQSSENDNNNKTRTLTFCPESTKIVDYLNQIRMRTIEELRKAQEEALEAYKLNSSRFSYLKEINEEEKIEALKSQLFSENFYFQIRYKSKRIFKVFTFNTDFYMSPSDINTLE